MRVLLVEDEVRLAEALQQLLTKNKYTVDVANDGLTGLDNASSGIYDVIVLDNMLPKLDGLELLRRLRQGGVRTHVILLTAKDEVSDKVAGLDVGADDYLTKPFSTEELLARLRAQGRRREESFVADYLTYGDLTLHLSDYILSHSSGQSAGRQISLGLKEFGILRLLMERAGGVISKEELITKIWGYDSEAEYNNVEVYISFLRKKLRHIQSGTAIATVRGSATG